MGGAEKMAMILLLLLGVVAFLNFGKFQLTGGPSGSGISLGLSGARVS